MSNKQEKNTMNQIDLLADYAHRAWSGWMNYLFSLSTHNDDGTVTIPAWAVERWKRQAGTPYQGLPEDEKLSDVAEAEKILALVKTSANLHANNTSVNPKQLITIVLSGSFYDILKDITEIVFYVGDDMKKYATRAPGNITNNHSKLLKQCYVALEKMRITNKDKQHGQ